MCVERDTGKFVRLLTCSAWSQGWQQMAAAYPNPTHQHLSAAAMFVLEVTRIDPHWAEWSETDVSAIRYLFCLVRQKISREEKKCRAGGLFLCRVETS